MTENTNILNLNDEFSDWELIRLGSIDSTNEELKRLYKNSHKKKNIILLSNKQTSGKGRHGRKWISPTNTGFYGSWLINKSFKNIHLIPLVSAITVAKVLSEITNNPILIKWPNDLVFKEKKIGGILVELIENSIIIGIGINICRSNEYPETSISLEEILGEVDFENTRNKILIKITKLLEHKLDTIKDENESTIVQEICNFLSTPIRSKVQFIKESNIYEGEVLGLTNIGELIIKIDNKEIIVLREGEIRLKAYNE
jgi:BirA family biotin operon repressor/biotin-[acetyl-CoA-carboxylase] ligase